MGYQRDRLIGEPSTWQTFRKPTHWCPLPEIEWYLGRGDMWRCPGCRAGWRVRIDWHEARLVWRRVSWAQRVWLWVLDRIGARLI